MNFTDNRAANGVAPSDPGRLGLKLGPHTFATSNGDGDGTVSVSGTLSLNAPTATRAGTYIGTINLHHQLNPRPEELICNRPDRAGGLGRREDNDG